MQSEDITIAVRKILPKGQRLTFDEIRFVIDEIAVDTVVGHYVAIRKRKVIYTFPPIRLKVEQAALMTGIQVKTGFKIRY